MYWVNLCVELLCLKFFSSLFNWCWQGMCLCNMVSEIFSGTNGPDGLLYSNGVSYSVYTVSMFDVVVNCIGSWYSKVCLAVL